MLMVGYLKGIGSDRGISWRCADSIFLHEFLESGLAKKPEKHFSLSKTRMRLRMEAYKPVFSRALGLLQASGLLSGKSREVDATTRSIVRRDGGTGYQGWLKQVAQA